MKRLIISITFVVACITVWGYHENDSTAIHHDFIEEITPHAARLQIAGNMGMVSAGPTWQYGKNKQWETSLLFGYTPKRHNSKSLKTITIKEDFTPWTIGRKKLRFQPLSTGLYVNVALGGDFWVSQPHRYPKGYYWFSTRLRPNFFLGERVKIDHPFGRLTSASFFYEFSICDFYFIQGVKNDWVTFDKYLALSLGVQIEW
ncbi:MAG: hypothetical protein IK092_03220 [Muribaculaceae bacterium]|nr:hypothetical protein [Muribaculaceae bacterium]